VLELEPESVEIDRFEGLATNGDEAQAAEEPQTAAVRFASALDLWRGQALADFVFEPFAQSEIARLEELRLLAKEGRIDAELSLGRSAEIASGIEELIREAPFGERSRAQLMLALYRAGRHADALEAYRRARDVLVEELGVEPGQELRDVERAILAQDDSIMGTARGRRQPSRPISRRFVTLVLAEVAVSWPNIDLEALLPLTDRPLGGPRMRQFRRQRANVREEGRHGR
jgi:DNA-binding SARP family transcriptional activator